MLRTADFIIIGVFACLLLLYRLVRDWYGIREAPRRIDHKAADFLREEGFMIRAKAAVKFIDFDIDGNSHHQKVKADLIARRGLKKYVVEVNAKDGGSVRNADIRRRLLEYQIAFAPNGILTVDMDKEKYRMITVNNRRWLVTLLGLATALALGAVIYLLVR